MHLVYDMNAELFKGTSLYNGQATQKYSYSVPDTTVT